ncbi:MAG: HU family DNA-binding protein [Tannerellaceae bacterium]|nr:HU family DNA-binding protein [Tannerellaceae bacterium]
MSINYSLYPIPTPIGKEEKEAYYYARTSISGTKGTEDLCEAISHATSFISGDVKGVIDALGDYISKFLESGYNVNLDGLGNFSLTLKCTNDINEAGKQITHTSIDGVRFRMSPKFKRKINRIKLKHVKRRIEDAFPQEERKARALLHLENSYSLSTVEYQQMNQCTKYRALADLKEMAEEGSILKIGRGRTTMYIKPYS